MVHLSVSLCRETVSARSRHGVVRLVVENGDPLLPVRVNNIVYDMTEGLTVRPFENGKVRDTKHCIAATCAELRRMVNDRVMDGDAQVAELRRRALDRDWPGLPIRALRFFLSAFSPALRRERRERDMERHAYGIAISDSADAELVWEQWFKRQEDCLLKEMFALKLEQLRLHEWIARQYQQNSWKAFELPPGSAFSQVFLIRCRRGVVNEIPESVTFKVNYSAPVPPQNGEECAPVEWEEKPKSCTVCDTFIITPFPFVLAGLAAFAGLAGKGLTTIDKVPELMGKLLRPSELLDDPFFYTFFSAGMLALIVFPALEYTPLGKKNKIPINWRTALLLGFIIGLFQTNIMHSFAALVTGSTGN
jgi:hypothetical protein